MRDMTGSVVVGYDASDHAKTALEWAAKEAARRGSSLVVLYAANYAGVLVGPAGAGAWLPNEADLVAHELADEGVERARSLTPGTDVSPVTALSGAVAALTEASRSADLVVVGTRGHGELVGALIGSVAFGVAAHAACPVVVVRGDSVVLPGPDRPVVVGVDGSACSDTAVGQAADHAASVGADLHLVTAWQVATSETWAAAYWADAYPGRDPLEVARASAEELLDEVKQRLASSHPDVKVTTQASKGGAAQALAAASHDAGLVVVGARGRGDFKSLLLGSVSRGVIHHATCPVLVVRDRD